MSIILSLFKNQYIDMVLLVASFCQMLEVEMFFMQLKLASI